MPGASRVMPRWWDFSGTRWETNEDVQALIWCGQGIRGTGISAADAERRIVSLVLKAGVAVAQPMTLMSAGLYNEPAGASCLRYYIESLALNG